MRLSIAACIFVFLIAVSLAQDVPEHVITISGNVTDSVTGRGIPGALVTLQSSPGKAELAAMRAQAEQDRNLANPRPFSPPAPRRAVTDEGGKYSFTLPEPGFASIQASHSGYLPGVSQAQRDLSQGINVKLVPTGVIEGRVVNSDGDPLQGVSVEMIQVQIQDGRRFLRTAQSARTNDLGEYRLWNIKPGSVYVKVAGYQGTYAGPGAAPPPANSSEAFPTVYYPASPDRESANLIRVGAGQTMRADFSMTAQKSYRIRGVIQNAASYKNLGARLMIGDDATGNRVSINTTSGAFEVYDVLPGSYTLQAFSRGPTVALGEASVAVGDHNITDVAVALTTGVDVQGVIEQGGGTQDDTRVNNAGGNGRNITGTAPRLPPNAPIQVVILQPGRIPVPGTQPPAQVDSGGHFTFKDMLPGKYALMLNTYNGYVESIRSGNTDVSADGLEIGSASPAELRVTLRRGGGSIHGVVTGLPPGEAGTVVLIRASGLSGIPTVAYAAVNQENGGDAQFFATNLAPGEYQVYAWPATREVEFRNPEAMRVLSGSSVAVSLHEHGNEQVTLKAIPAEIP